MLCPVCHHDNLEGLDSCENCGADLRTADIPQAGSRFENILMSEHLSRLEPRVPVAVNSSDPADSAIKLMQDEEIGCVLVNEGDRLVGIFTERDALLKLGGKSLQGVSVKDVMTGDPVVLREEDTLAIALHKMAIGGFRHIPIVEGSRATGIISARDIFGHIVKVI
jgi:CBS domain-containing protein